MALYPKLVHFYRFHKARKREVLPSDLCLNQLQIPLTLALKSGLTQTQPSFESLSNLQIKVIEWSLYSITLSWRCCVSQVAGLVVAKWCLRVCTTAASVNKMLAVRTSSFVLPIQSLAFADPGFGDSVQPGPKTFV